VRWNKRGRGREAETAEWRISATPRTAQENGVFSRAVFSTAGPRPGTGPWHQLYRAVKGSPGIYHFIFLSIFHE